MTDTQSQFHNYFTKLNFQVIPVQNIKSAVALDWDHNSNSIFWTDVEKDTINKAYLNGSQQVVVVGSNLSKY